MPPSPIHRPGRNGEGWSGLRASSRAEPPAAPHRPTGRSVAPETAISPAAGSEVPTAGEIAVFLPTPFRSSGPRVQPAAGSDGPSSAAASPELPRRRSPADTDAILTS